MGPIGICHSALTETWRIRNYSFLEADLHLAYRKRNAWNNKQIIVPQSTVFLL